MDVLFVNPSSRKQTYQGLGDDLAALEPPFWCALPAAYLRERGYHVGILDAELDALSPAETARRVMNKQPDLVCVPVMGRNPSASSTPAMVQVHELLAALHEQDPLVVTALMGIHPAALPERTLTEEPCEYVIQGEGLHTLEGLLEARPDSDVPGLWYRQGDRVRFTKQAPLAVPDELPVPAWDLLPMERYRAHNWSCWGGKKREPYGVIYSSLGCSFHCFFCNVHAMYDGKAGMRFRSAEKVVDEVDWLASKLGVRNFKFLDELFAVKPSQVEAVCGGIEERGLDINAWAYARIDTMRPAMARQMKAAGINWVAYGIESAAENVRRDVDKRYSQEQIVAAVDMAREAGLSIIGNFIFGLPEDDPGTMQANLDMAERFNFEYANFYCAMAYPGSELYVQAQADILPESWSGFGQYAVDCTPLPTRFLSPAEVLRFRDAAFEHYYSRPEYLGMMEAKFGSSAVEDVRGMLKVKLQRKLLEGRR